MPDIRQTSQPDQSCSGKSGDQAYKEISEKSTGEVLCKVLDARRGVVATTSGHSDTEDNVNNRLQT